MTHAIDCHVLTLPRSRHDWMADLRADLDREPVNQHWIPGIDGDLGAARAAGFAAGDAPYVTSQDPDDRVMPGVYVALRRALEENPTAPFAWAGEQLVDDDLSPLPLAPVLRPYSPLLHVKSTLNVHGVKLYRRELVMPLLDGMRRAGQCCEFYLDLALVQPWTNPPPSSYPALVPIVGRLWRQHPEQVSRCFAAAHFDRAAHMLGFESMEALRTATYEARR